MHLSVSFVLASVLAATAFADPCADISSSKWVTPKQVRDCFKSFKVDQTLKANVRFFFLPLNSSGMLKCYRRPLTSSTRLSLSTLRSTTKSVLPLLSPRTFMRTCTSIWHELVTHHTPRNSTSTSTFPGLSRGSTTVTVFTSTTAMTVSLLIILPPYQKVH